MGACSPLSSAAPYSTPLLWVPSRALFEPGEWDEQETATCVAADIEREFPMKQSGRSIDAEGFCASLFETVDVWTVSAEEVR